MKKLISRAYLIALLVLLQSSSFANDYILVRFADASKIPSVTFRNSSYTLTFNDPALTALFANYTVTNFAQAYPAANALSGTLADSLKWAYHIEVSNGTTSLYNSIISLSSADIGVIYLKNTANNILLTDPDDYYNTNVTNNWPNAWKHLDFINAKQAWNYTKGLSCVVIAIADINFEHHADIDANLLSGGTASVAAAGTYSSSSSHGIEVAGNAAGCN